VGNALQRFSLKIHNTIFFLQNIQHRILVFPPLTWKLYRAVLSSCFTFYLLLYTNRYAVNVFARLETVASTPTTKALVALIHAEIVSRSWRAVTPQCWTVREHWLPNFSISVSMRILKWKKIKHLPHLKWQIWFDFWTYVTIQS